MQTTKVDINLRAVATESNSEEDEDDELDEDDEDDKHEQRFVFSCCCWLFS